MTIAVYDMTYVIYFTRSDDPAKKHIFAYCSSREEAAETVKYYQALDEQHFQNGNNSRVWAYDSRD